LDRLKEILKDDPRIQQIDQDTAKERKIRKTIGKQKKTKKNLKSKKLVKPGTPKTKTKKTMVDDKDKGYYTKNDVDIQMEEEHINQSHLSSSDYNIDEMGTKTNKNIVKNFLK
jgi:hypothetical protein